MGGCDIRLIFKWSTTGFEFSFPFFNQGWRTSLPYYLSIVERIRMSIYAFAAEMAWLLLSLKGITFYLQQALALW